MPRLQNLSGSDVIRLLNKIGYRAVRQRGSHIRLAHPNRKSVTVPDYPTISRGLLRKIFRDAELTSAEITKLQE